MAQVLRVRITGGTLWLVCALAQTLCSSQAQADTVAAPLAAPLGTDRCAAEWEERVYTKIRPAVVRLKVGDGRGAGFLWGRPGRVATAYHVVNHPGAIIAVLADGTERNARVVSADARFDIALLELDGPVSIVAPLEDRDPSTVPIGAPLAAIGHPFAHELAEGKDQKGLFVWALTTGILSGRNGDFLLTDVALNPGNSGGPVLDCEGRVVGVVSQSTGTLGIAVSTVHLGEVARRMTGRPLSLAGRFGGAIDLGWDGRFAPGGFMTGPSLGVALLVPGHVVLRVGFTGLLGTGQTNEGADVVTSRTGVRFRGALGLSIPNPVLPLVPSVGIVATYIVEHRLQLGSGGIESDDVGVVATRFSPSFETGWNRLRISYEAEVDFGHVADTAHTLRFALRL